MCARWVLARESKERGVEVCAGVGRCEGLREGCRGAIRAVAATAAVMAEGDKSLPLHLHLHSRRRQRKGRGHTEPPPGGLVRLF